MNLIYRAFIVVVLAFAGQVFKLLQLLLLISLQTRISYSKESIAK